ncbi:hypothetical protein [Nocardia tengchongensis]
MRTTVLSSIAISAIIGSFGLSSTASADAGDPMMTWNVDNGLTFHFGNNTIEPFPGSQSCYYRIAGKYAQMHSLVSGSVGRPEQPLTGTITGPTVLALETGETLTTDCLPSVLH